MFSKMPSVNLCGWKIVIFRKNIVLAALNNFTEINF